MNKFFCLRFIALIFLINASVFSQDLIINTLNNLDFGDVYIGYSKTVNHADIGAAKFRIDHNIPGNQDLQITFTLPNTLNNGAYSIPITFSSATTAYSIIDNLSGRVNFNPNTTFTYTKFKRKDLLYLWLGGIVNVPTNVVAGVYQSTITVTIVVF